MAAASRENSFGCQVSAGISHGLGHTQGLFCSQHAQRVWTAWQEGSKKSTRAAKHKTRSRKGVGEWSESNGNVDSCGMSKCQETFLNSAPGWLQKQPLPRANTCPEMPEELSKPSPTRIQPRRASSIPALLGGISSLSSTLPGVTWWQQPHPAGPFQLRIFWDVQNWLSKGALPRAGLGILPTDPHMDTASTGYANTYGKTTFRLKATMLPLNWIITWLAWMHFFSCNTLGISSPKNILCFFKGCPQKIFKEGPLNLSTWNLPGCPCYSNITLSLARGRRALNNVQKITSTRKKTPGLKQNVHWELCPRWVWNTGLGFWDTNALDAPGGSSRQL